MVFVAIAITTLMISSATTGAKIKLNDANRLQKQSNNHETSSVSSEEHFEEELSTNIQSLGTGNYYGKYCDIRSAFIRAPFECIRIPGIGYHIRSSRGGEIDFVDHAHGLDVKLSGNKNLDIKMIIFLGFFVPPPHNGINLFPRAFSGWAYELIVDIS